MYAKVFSSSGLRFFAHAPGAPKCALAGESPVHHLLKLELAAAARQAGAYAELEVRGSDGAWWADVLASDPAGAWRAALEAQDLYGIDVAETAFREKEVMVKSRLPAEEVIRFWPAGASKDEVLMGLGWK
ncbi:hypothetical protein [Streptomyces sp. NPDC091027]|uniref:hypothetical protein n=1 Tax=Streptomyces sp. NPDC091027 TaxID=3365971 RepID=UPI003809BA6B